VNFYKTYNNKLHEVLTTIDHELVEILVDRLFYAWENKHRIFICGNGGSAANATHIANDLTYGVNPSGRALDVEALTANIAVVTCLANDTGFENIFAHQLKTKLNKDDILIVLSGSGNSPNIIEALLEAKKNNAFTCAVVGYSGGEAKELSDLVIHTEIDDMQISEDVQIIIGHWLMRRLNQRILGNKNE